MKDANASSTHHNNAFRPIVDSDEDYLLAPSPKKTTTTTTLVAATSRPFKLTTTATTSSRAIYGRHSRSFDPRLNSRVRNEQRVPMDVRIRSHSHENVTLRPSKKVQRGSRMASTTTISQFPSSQSDPVACLPLAALPLDESLPSTFATAHNQAAARFLSTSTNIQIRYWFKITSGHLTRLKASVRISSFKKSIGK